jgi:hypothetical protein
MITRIVKMGFAPENTDAFQEIFKQSKSHIEAMPGCCGVTLLRDVQSPNIFFTYSRWEDESFLEAYRQSELFAGVWAKTKALFNTKPEAWSTREL